MSERVISEAPSSEAHRAAAPGAWLVPSELDGPAAIALAGVEGSERLLRTIGTRRVSVAATTGAGKTYAALRLLELLHRVGSPFVVIDPVGNFWGLRVAADGASPGLRVPVLGGAHGDLPLYADTGRKVAELLARRPTSLVLDLSRQDDDERARFVTDLTRALLALWSEKRRVLTVVLDEAQDFLPEMLSRKKDAGMRSALTALALKGRNFGLGLFTLTQAPQLVHKRVFNLADLLLVGRLGGHHERKAIEQWVRQRGVQAKETLEEVPTLSPGTFFAWSPEWLSFFGRVSVSERETFDASRTPELGGIEAQQGVLAPVDLGVLERELRLATKLGEASPDASEEAPGTGDGWNEENRAALEHRLQELDRRIAPLEQRLREALQAARHYQSYFESVRQELARLRGTLSAVEGHLEGLDSLLEQTQPELPDEPAASARPATPPAAVTPTTPLVERARQWERESARSTPAARSSAPAPAPREPMEGTAKGASNGYVEGLLATIARHGPLNRARLSILSGKSRSSTTFASALRSLVAEGLVVDEGELAATPLGRRRASAPPLPTGAALFRFWMGQLKAYDQATFQAVFAAPTRGLTRKELSQLTKHSLSSTTFAQSIRRLVSMGLCEVREQRVRVIDHVRKAMTS